MSLVSRFTLDGVADTTYGIELRPGYDEPMLPGVRTRSVDIPGRAGRWEFQGDLGAREINLPCVATAATQEALASLGRALAAALLDDDGYPTDISLVFLKESTKTYTVRYNGLVSVQRLVGSSIGEFVLPFIAADPFAYGAEETTTETDITASPTTIDNTNDGTVSTPCVITITNTGGTDITGIKITQRKVV